jgi:RNA polymerase sigma-70 factor (ECF subfamily)
MTAPSHVASEMPAHAMTITPAPTPAAAEGAQLVAAAPESVDAIAVDAIATMIRDGQHRNAIAACARAHAGVIGRLCMAMLSSRADADEAVQETLLRAHRGMATYRAEGSIKAWLCGIARHVCVHALETRRRGRELLELVPTADEARDDFANRRRAHALRDALTRLKPSEREALLLRYVADLSHREIATACNLDEATARKRISRALARLRSILPHEELT